MTWWQRLWHRHLWELVIDRGQMYLQCACGAKTCGWVETDR